MSDNRLKLYWLAFLLITCFTQVFAQPKDNTPFSRFGLGDYIDTDMPSVHGMGGLNSAYFDFFESNLDNPASLGFLQYTNLQVGLYARRSAIKRQDQKDNIWSGNLNHLSLTIPIINPLNEALERRETDFSWGTGISLRPYTQVGYDVRIEDEVDSFGIVNRTFTGSGGLYQIQWTNGIKYKNLSVGISLGYLYGNQEYNEEVAFPDLENSYTDIFNTGISYSDLRFRLGAIYDLPLDVKAARARDDKPSRFLTAGLYYEGETTFKTESDVSQLIFNELTNDLDTALLEKGLAGAGTMPSGFGFGLIYRHAGDFRVGVDYQTAKWSSFRNDARPVELNQMEDASRFAFGAAWIPDAASITSYLDRIEYRAGFYSNKDPRVIEGEQVKEFAVTLGASMPLIVQRNIAWVQLGLDFGKRTGGPNLSDNFTRFRIGLIFNDNSWFIKGKYN